MSEEHSIPVVPIAMIRLDVWAGLTQSRPVRYLYQTNLTERMLGGYLRYSLRVMLTQCSLRSYICSPKVLFVSSSACVLFSVEHC